MIAALGYAAVLVALGAAVMLGVQGIRDAREADFDPRRLRAMASVLFAAALVAFLSLEILILTHDFSVAYVARHTSTTTPFVFLLASGWAALEGSIVLWGIVLAGYTWLVSRRIRRGDGLGAGAVAVMAGVAVFWFGLMATAANPFALCAEVAGGVCTATSWLPFGASAAPIDGLGPNPLLRNHILMAVHPPMLYFGYVGFTVPFAFAISALARAEQGRTWLDRTLRWSLIAWVFLTAGIFLGGWWSYEVLGWGGYWAWDPVENAALLPWLMGTAFIHSAVVQRRRGMLQAWNYVLVIATFVLTILGTFLTRSGVIASVHSFTQSAVGPALLAFLGVVVVGSLALFAVRADLVSSSPRLDSLISREGFLLLNNLLLTLLAFTVLFGTMYPLIVEAFAGDQVSVGRPFFDRAAVPLGLALLLAMGVGSVTPWRVARGSVLWERLRSPLTIGLVAGAVAVLLGVRSIGVVLVVVLAGFVVATIIRQYSVSLMRARRGGKVWSKAFTSVIGSDMGYWGGMISHVGLALVAVAIATTSALAIRQEVRLSPGDTETVGAYCVRYIEPFERSETGRFVQGLRIEVLRSDCSSALGTYEPRVHFYEGAAQGIATPAVHSNLIDDVYLSLAGGTAEEAALDVFVFPLQWLLWVGGGIVVVGGVVALGRKRRRDRPAPSSARAVEAGVGDG